MAEAARTGRDVSSTGSAPLCCRRLGVSD